MQPSVPFCSPTVSGFSCTVPPSLLSCLPSADTSGCLRPLDTLIPQPYYGLALPQAAILMSLFPLHIASCLCGNRWLEVVCMSVHLHMQLSLYKEGQVTMSSDLEIGRQSKSWPRTPVTRTVCGQAGDWGLWEVLAVLGFSWCYQVFLPWPLKQF